VTEGVTDQRRSGGVALGGNSVGVATWWGMALEVEAVGEDVREQCSGSGVGGQHGGGWHQSCVAVSLGPICVFLSSGRGSIEGFILS